VSKRKLIRLFVRWAEDVQMLLGSGRHMTNLIVPVRYLEGQLSEKLHFGWERGPRWVGDGDGGGGIIFPGHPHHPPTLDPFPTQNATFLTTVLQDT
jgi:hypothetical protein